MTIKQIKEKMVIGDFVTAGKLLGISAANARMRFKREREDAIRAMTEIIESREKMIIKHPKDRKRYQRVVNK